ncbi:MAG: ASKHA domain-containing protein [Thermodesulfobacteriota bacterium]
MSREENNRYSVTFLPADKSVQVKTGESLIHAARKAGIHINASCGGAGVCGKCRLLLEAGEVEGGRSEKLLAEDFDRGYRQACISTVKQDVTVRIPEESGRQKGGLSTEIPPRHRARMHVFNMEKLKESGIFYPPVEKLRLELAKPEAHDNRADVGRLIQGLADQQDKHRMVTGLSVMRKIRAALREKDFLITVTLELPVNDKSKSHILNIQPGSWNHRNFGLAVDIGTTTIYGVLIDLNSGKVLAKASCYNPQVSYGEDVIARIIYAEKPKGLAMMQSLVVEAINRIIATVLKEATPPQDCGHGAIERDEINSITIAGNTTMTHLFLELEPDNIRRSPYVPVSTFFPPLRATDLGLEVPQHCVALLYPAISSYVGGDIVAGVMGSGMYRTELLTLFIDVGTNAEIVIGNKEWLACAACSAGPAFEGGGITHGMRAVEGAISDFSLNPDTLEPMNVTEGNKAPIGICGSGLLIIVATLFEHGLLNQSGKFNDIDSPRIREGRSGHEYVLAWKEESSADHDIVINEVDIENFIRAKGAIFAGVATLLEQVGLAVGDLEQIILAGGFGSFIDLDSAMGVGLLPEVDPDKILYVGNGSLMGAWMSELSNHIRKDVVKVVRKMTSFELSEIAGFKDQYVASLFLPHTDLSLFPESTRRRTVSSDPQ